MSFSKLAIASAGFDFLFFDDPTKSGGIDFLPLRTFSYSYSPLPLPLKKPKMLSIVFIQEEN